MRCMVFVLLAIHQVREDLSAVVVGDGKHMHPEKLRSAELRLVKQCQIEAFRETVQNWRD